MTLNTPDSVLKYWFGSNDQGQMISVDYIENKMGIWFAGKCPKFDAVQRANSSLVDMLGAPDVGSEWSTPGGVLARVLVLDQFTRCIYRGTAKAFEYDGLTSSLIKLIVERQWLVSEYVPIQRFFLGVAIQHAEDLMMQTIGVNVIASAVSLGACDDVVNYFNNIKGYPHEHYEVIEKFGRFPSRNHALGRDSTEEEVAWMDSPSCPNWARSQMKK